MLAGCATNYTPDDRAAPASESLEQARAHVKSSIVGASFAPVVTDVLFDSRAITFVYDGGNQEVAVSDLAPRAEGTWFWDVFLPAGWCTVLVTSAPSGFSFRRDGIDMGCGEDAHRIVDALVSLKRATERAQAPRRTP